MEVKEKRNFVEVVEVVDDDLQQKKDKLSKKKAKKNKAKKKNFQEVKLC